MDGKLEFATLGRPREQALEEFKRGRHYPRRTLAEQRLDQVEREIKQELFELAVSVGRLSRDETPRPLPPLAVGLGAAVFGDTVGELLVGR
jgi:hypothetical protein